MDAGEIEATYKLLYEHVAEQNTKLMNMVERCVDDLGTSGRESREQSHRANREWNRARKIAARASRLRMKIDEALGTDSDWRHEHGLKLGVEGAVVLLIDEYEYGRRVVEQLLKHLYSDAEGSGAARGAGERFLAGPRRGVLDGIT